MWPENSQIVDIGVDYFTTTSTNKEVTELLLLKGDQYLFQEEKLGFDIKGWSMFGYSGYRCGRVEHGARNDQGIVRLSSVLAALNWWDVFQITGRCSRVDLQITYRIDGDVNRQISDAEAYVREYFDTRTDGPTVTVWYDSRGGRTLYLGKRTSGAYCRIYNKAVESGDDAYENCLRIELEYKNRYTLPVLEFLLSSETVQTGICLCVSNYAHDRGIPTNHASADLRPSCLPTLKTDALSKLRWLHDSCSPTILRLVADGRLDEVISALCLDKFVVKR